MTKIRDEKYLKALGKRIKSIRMDQGLSTYQFSYDSDVSRSQIHSIEKGEQNPSICTLKVMAEALGLELKDLLDF